MPRAGGQWDSGEGSLGRLTILVFKLFWALPNFWNPLGLDEEAEILVGKRCWSPSPGSGVAGPVSDGICRSALEESVDRTNRTHYSTVTIPVGVAPAQCVRTTQGDDFLIVETLPVEDVANVSNGGGLGTLVRCPKPWLRRRIQVPHCPN